jgi:putative pyruvate formate lyase activating enzyme
MGFLKLASAERGDIYKGLRSYKEILDGRKKAGFLLSRESGVLKRKIKKARNVLERCELCHRKCGVNRLEGGTGFCGVGNEPRVFGAHPHFGEEPELVPSATLFFSGCTMRCVYCQNAPDSVEYERGVPWTAGKIAEFIEEMAASGCRNVNFVGGDPTPNLPWILEALQKVDANIPVVWNSNSYYSEKTAEILRGVVDVYLLDFRYFDEKCAVRLSSAPGYPEVAKRNILAAGKDAELLIRILVMPNHLGCDARPIIKWIRDNLGPGVRTNILPQYRPCWKAHEYKEISEPLSRRDYESALSYAKSLGLENLVRD